MSHKLPKSTIATVILGALILSKKFQPRASLDKDAVKDYTELAAAAKAKGVEDPFNDRIEVIKRGDEFILFRGFHRVSAFRNADFTEVKADVYEVPADFTDDDIFLAALADNNAHGVRYTNEDKLHNLLRVLKIEGIAEKPNTEIAELAGVSEFFVRKNRPVDKNPAVKTVTNKKTGKKTRVNTSKIGKKTGKTPKPAKAAKGEPKTPKAPAEDADLQKALRRLGTLLKDKYPKLIESIENGTLPLSGKEVKAWATTSDGRALKIAPLVVENQYTPSKAFDLIDKPVTTGTKVSELINASLATNGVTSPAFNAFGEKVTDNEHFTVLVYDKRKFTVTVEPKK